MKILCPIDFSVASVDALRYAVAIGAKFDGCKIDLLHCVNPNNQDRIFKDEIIFLETRATVKMQRLAEEVSSLNSSIGIRQIVLKGDPLTLILAHIEENDYDYTILGAKGMRSAKDRPIGSTTENLFQQARCPVLAVPQAYIFRALDNAVLAVDISPVSSQKVLEPLLRLVTVSKTHLELLHVRQKEDQKLEYDSGLDQYLSGIDFNYYSKFTSGSVTKAINEVCLHVNADLLCLIHYHRGWMPDLFHYSQVKKELLQISMPILILHDSYKSSVK